MTFDLTPPVAPQSQPPVSAVRALIENYSIETTPKAAEKVEAFDRLLPPGTQVFIPALPGADPGRTFSLARRLVLEGMVPVPHLAARAMASEAALALWLEDLWQAGVRDLLLVAGDRARPAGPFASTLDVLGTGFLERLGFRRLRFAGHPEGHAAVRSQALEEALDAKADYAARTGAEVSLVTQFAFSAEPVTRWLSALEARGLGLTARVGLPGPASLTTLITYALQCGIGNSAKALKRNAGLVGRLARTWTPEEMLPALALHRRVLGRGTLAGLHIFPFGGLTRSVAWCEAVRKGEVGADS